MSTFLARGSGFRPALETDAADHRDVMDIDLRAAHCPSVGVARGMIAAGEPGSIMHVPSQMVPHAVHASVSATYHVSLGNPP